MIPLTILCIVNIFYLQYTEILAHVNSCDDNG
jgi:hypothetical protein